MSKRGIRTENLMDMEIKLPSSTLKVGTDSVKVSHKSRVSIKEFIKGMQDAAKKDLFGFALINNG